MVQQVGKYEILRELGRGAFGTVYLARDTVLDVPRALKVLHPALLADATAVERFRREARLAARLEHPNIATVYDFGQAEDRFYLAMRYMEGGSLKERLEQGPLPWEEVVRIVHDVAAGLAYAHEQGVVHRDLKPGNILFDAKGRAAVTDFGLAKALRGAGESMSLTMSGGLIGTPAYMAPELWQGQEATPATDQYALACIVYEMVTGKVLFSGDTPWEVVGKHKEGPRFPERWPEGVPEGVSEVLAKGLATEAEKRYPDILAFSEAMAGVDKPFVAGGVRKERKDYQTEEGSGQGKVSVQGERARVEQKGQVSLSLLRVLGKGNNGTVQSVSFSPDGELLASGSSDGTVQLWRISDGTLLHAFRGHASQVNSVVFAPSGTMLASGSADTTVRLWGMVARKLMLAQTLKHSKGVRSVAFSPDGNLLACGTGLKSVLIWDLSHRKSAGYRRGHKKIVYSVAFSPDGKLMASGSGDKTVQIHPTMVGKGKRHVLGGHSKSVMSVAFSPNGAHIASGSIDKTIRLWRVPDGALLRILEGHTSQVNSVVFSPNGMLLASGATDHTVRLWRVTDGALMYTLKSDIGSVRSVAFSPGGRVLATGSSDGMVRLWRVEWK